jgi:hypothetical protein
MTQVAESSGGPLEVVPAPADRVPGHPKYRQDHADHDSDDARILTASLALCTAVIAEYGDDIAPDPGNGAAAISPAARKGQERFSCTEAPLQSP